MKWWMMIVLLIPVAASPQYGRFPQSFSFTRLHANLIKPDAVGIAANPAGLGKLEAFSAAMLSERRFGMEELQDLILVAALPAALINTAVSARHFGNSNGSETELGAGFGKSLGPGIAVGIRFNYYLRSIRDWGNASALTAEAGIMVKLSGEIRSSLWVYNPTEVAIGKTGEKLRSVVAWGMGYEVSSQVFLAADVRKMAGQSVDVMAGLEYRPAERLMMCTGFAPATASWYLGTGYRFRGINVLVSVGRHRFLGWTPGLVVGYNAGL